MADISKITLPSGTTYNIKDEEARTAIANINSFDYILCTSAANTPQGVTWQSGSTTITGTLVASSSTKGKMYLVPDSIGTKDIYDEYITVNTTGTTYIWERFGHTGQSIGDLGDLAYKDSASGSYTPSGTVSQPTFTGTSSSVTITATDNANGNYQPKGTVSQPTFTGSSTTSTGSFTPEGTVNVSTNATTNKTATVSPASSGTATYTPGGNVSAPTISVATAGSTTTVNSITAVGTLPEWTGTVSNEVLTIAWSAGTLPTKGSNTTVKTGDAAYSATAPTFTGTGVRLVTGNIAVPNTYTATFTGSSGSISVTGTPSGTVSQPTFTGTKAQLSGTTTASGTVSQPTFTGTQGTVTVS